jgi:flagellar basal-body rod modification protein FlgD
MDFQTVPGVQIPTSGSQSSSQKNGLSTLADYESFLKLFVTQLRYQDPLSPASQDEFLAQTAQFSSVEQLMQLNEKMADFAVATRMSAASLIGTKVAGTVTGGNGTPSPVSGTVAELGYGEKGNIVLGLQDGTILPLADVDSISQA